MAVEPSCRRYWRDLASCLGLRPAEPGEFTRRAFLNGRVDLTEVEGLSDLIQAETEAQRRQAVRQASGGLREVFDGWRARLVKARAMVEAELDFADEEDVPGSVSDLAWVEAAEIAAEIGRHLDDQRSGERLRDGAEVVLVGPVNAGKSSLINALAKTGRGDRVAGARNHPGHDRSAARYWRISLHARRYRGSSRGRRSWSSVRECVGRGHGRGPPTWFWPWGM